MARLTDRLHDKTVKAAKPKDKKYELRDGKGLVLRIYPNGEKRWYFNYDFMGRRRNMMLGEYPAMPVAEARVLRNKASGLRREKIDPLTARQDKEREDSLNPTFSELATKYLDTKKVKDYSERYRTDCRRTYEKYTPRGIRQMHVKEIKPHHITSITDKMEDQGNPVAAQRALAHLSALFKFAQRKGEVPQNPCSCLTVEIKNRKEPVVLRPNEIKALWKTVDSFKTHINVRNALRFQFLTLTRRGEVCKSEWKQIDWAERIWTLPSANVKNKKCHRLYLTDTALAILQDQKTIAGQSKWVFPGINKPSLHLDPDTVTQAVRENRHLCGIDKAFNTHTLRKTAATRAIDAGALRDFVKRTLNHSFNDVTEFYDRYTYDREKREVLEIWERRLVEIIADEDDGRKSAKH